MRALTLLLLTCIGALAQGGSYCTMSTWEPRNLATKAGLVASYDPGNTNTLIYNGSKLAGIGISAMSNRVTAGTADLLQGTAANQPQISRNDNCGNLLKQSEAFNTTWSLVNCNAFGAIDTGALNAGSFANTMRTLDPLGGNTADFIQIATDSGQSHYVRQAGVPSSATESYTYSVFAKADAISRIVLRYGTGAGRGFDLSNGTTYAANSVSAPTSYSIASSANGFYLCSITVIGDPGAVYFQIYLGSGTAIIINGDGTSGVFLWGASIVSSAWTKVTGTSASLGYISTTTAPIFPGIGGRSVLYFDGSAHYMKTASFTLNQPTEIYSLACPWTWTLNDAMFDGNTLNSGKLYQSATSPNIRYTAGTVGTEFVPPPAGTWRVSNVVFDGANSRISTNSGAFVVSDAGTGNMGGFTLGAAGTVGTTFWNGLRGREMICNKTNALAEASYLRWGLLKQAGLQ